MRNYKLLFLLVSISLFFSNCQDDTELSTELPIVNEILSLEGESQKLAYRMLSSDERYAVWNHKFKSVLEKENLNEAQLDFVLNLKRELRPEYFESDLSETNVELYDRFQVFKKEAIKLFEKEELKSYFSNINVEVGDEEGGGSGKRDCNCNKNASLFCPWTSTCEGISCNESSSGCGWFWQDPCNGVCAQVIVL